MRVPRFLVDADLARHFAGDRRVDLGPEAVRHAVTVLRLKPGAALRVFDGRGGEFLARVLEARRGGARIELVEPHPALVESPFPIVLALGVSRRDRMDLAVQKSVELGVSRIVPLWTARSVVRPHPRKDEDRLARWRRIAAGACEQCGRSRVPLVEPPRPLGEWLDRRPRAGAAIRLASESGHSFSSLPSPEPPVTILVGPEGGLDPGEAERAAASGFVAVRLGPRTMRTETAVIAAVAAAQLRWGDLGHGGGSGENRGGR